MKRYQKLIFIDSSDTTRSPMAMMIMKQKFLREPLEIHSRGLIVLFPEPINQKAEAVLISNGYEPHGHMSSPLTQADIGTGEGVLILTMEESLREKVLEEFSNLRSLYTLNGFVGGKGDVIPLYGAPLTEYGQYYENLNTLLDKVADKLNEKEMQV